MMRKVYQHIQCMLCHYRGQRSLPSVGFHCVSTMTVNGGTSSYLLFRKHISDESLITVIKFYFHIKFGNFQVYFQCRHTFLHEIMNFDCIRILCWWVYSRALYLFVNLSLTSYVTIIEFMESFWHLNGICKNMTEIWKSSFHNFVNQNS